MEMDQYDAKFQFVLETPDTCIVFVAACYNKIIGMIEFRLFFKFLSCR